MKFCYNCGAKIEEGDKFCVECGAKLSLAFEDEGADAKPEEETRLKAEEEDRRKAAEEEIRRRAEEDARKAAEEEARRRATEEEARRRTAEEEARRRAAEEEARRRTAEEEARRRAAEEETRRRAAKEENRRKAAEEEEARRRAAEEEAHRRAEEEVARRRAAEEEEARVERETAFTEFYGSDSANSEQKSGKPDERKSKGTLVIAILALCLAVGTALFFIFVIGTGKKMDDDGTTQSTDKNRNITKFHGKFEIRDENSNVLLDTEDIQDVNTWNSYDADNQKENYGISITFTEVGAKKLEQVTKYNLNKPIYIYIGGELVSAPVIKGVLSGGLIEIEAESREEADKMFDLIVGGDIEDRKTTEKTTEKHTQATGKATEKHTQEPATEKSVTEMELSSEEKEQLGYMLSYIYRVDEDEYWRQGKKLSGFQRIDAIASVMLVLHWNAPGADVKENGGKSYFVYDVESVCSMMNLILKDDIGSDELAAAFDEYNDYWIKKNGRDMFLKTEVKGGKVYSETDVGEPLYSRITSIDIYNQEGKMDVLFVVGGAGDPEEDYVAHMLSDGKGGVYLDSIEPR